MHKKVGDLFITTNFWQKRISRMWACICSTYCFVGQKFGSSIYSTSEQRVKLFIFSRQCCWSKRKCVTFLPPWFLPLGHDRYELLSLVPSLTQRLFVTPIVTTYVGCQKRCKALTVWEKKWRLFIKIVIFLMSLMMLMYTVFDEGFEDDEFYEWLTVK